jgi:class 3 adenylate cyclase
MTDIDDVFCLAYTANSLTKVLNYKMKKRGYEKELKFGIGISLGRALMIKAGYSGSGINDIVYMGDVVNSAAKLASRGSNGWGVPPIFVDELVYRNLNDLNQSLLTPVRYEPIYSGDVIDADMEKWYVENCT